jgi:hypothetical protein
VLHLDEHGRGGPASTWAAAARPGDPLTLLGPTVAAGATPGRHRVAPTGPRAGAPVRVLLAGDETAVPAVSSVLDGLGDGYVGDVLLEVPHATDVQDVRDAGRVRPPGSPAATAARRGARAEPCRALLDGAPPAPSAAGLLPDVDVDTDRLWETRAAPAASTLDRRRGRRSCATCAVPGPEHGVDRRSVAFMGYWRQGRAEATRSDAATTPATARAPSGGPTADLQVEVGEEAAQDVVHARLAAEASP